MFELPRLGKQFVENSAKGMYEVDLVMNCLVY